MQYDHIVVGSGAGGAAAAYALANAGRRVLILEKGDELPRDGSTLDVRRVIQNGEFKSREAWLDREGALFAPEEYFNWGGKTRWYGAALLRFAPEEFRGDEAFAFLPWPIAYDDLAPYYAQAERLLGVREFEIESDLRDILQRLQRGGTPWVSHPLPLGLAPEIAGCRAEASHFDGFASVRDLKHDADNSLLALIRHLPNVTVRMQTPVEALISTSRDTAVRGVRSAAGEEFHGDTVILAAGALHSPRLLQHFAKAHLASPLSGVGENFKRHLLTAVIAFSPSRKHDVLRKTALLTSPEFPHSTIQPLGFNADVIAALMPRVLPDAVSSLLAERAYGFFLQTEEGSSPDNQVRMANGKGYPELDYDAARTAPSEREHRGLVKAFRRALFSAGLVSGAQAIPLAGTAHACGTLAAGHDPTRSAVNAWGRVHRLDNVFVADGSVLPRVSRVNPSLSIFAWGLRLGEALAAGRTT